jgi:TRAP-type C4-dicarboxylate transport system substrate-binding protein
VPENTPWGEALNKMSKEWSEATNGEVELVVYHGGVAGGEHDVLRKLKMNQLQAAILTSFGMDEINSGVLTLSCPFLIRNYDELDAVLAKLKPQLEAGLTGKGYRVVAWSQVGWVRFFSKIPVVTPDDMRKQKLGTDANEQTILNAFKLLGFQMIPIDITQTLVGLTGGMIDAVYQSPIAAASYQLFGVAKNMTDMLVAPFMGGVVMTERAFQTIPEKHRDKCLAIARKVELELADNVIKLEDEALGIMKDYGLKVHAVSDAQKEAWYKIVDEATPKLVGTLFDREIYSTIQDIVREKRAGK